MLIRNFYHGIFNLLPKILHVHQKLANVFEVFAKIIRVTDLKINSHMKAVPHLDYLNFQHNLLPYMLRFMSYIHNFVQITSEINPVLTNKQSKEPITWFSELIDLSRIYRLIYVYINKYSFHYSRFVANYVCRYEHVCL